jgi:hypothetical protein
MRFAGDTVRSSGSRAMLVAIRRTVIVGFPGVVQIAFAWDWRSGPFPRPMPPLSSEDSGESSLEPTTAVQH